MSWKQISRAIERETSALMRTYVCAWCHTSYVPLFEMGRRHCEVHPERRNYHGELSSFHQTRPRPLLGASPLQHALSGEHNQHGCCGSSNANLVEFSTKARLIDQSGCTRSDHTPSLEWHQVDTTCFRDSTDDPETGTITASFTHTEVVVSDSHRNRHALSKRFYVFPIFFMEHLATVYNEELRLQPQKYRLSPIDTSSTESVLTHFFGDNHACVGTNLIDLVREHQKVVFNVGTTPLAVDLRDAYIHLCTRFHFSRLIITNPERFQQLAQDRVDLQFDQAQALYDLDYLKPVKMEEGVNHNGTGVVPMDMDDDDEVQNVFYPFVIAPVMDATRLDAGRVGSYYPLTTLVSNPSSHPVDIQHNRYIHTY